VLPLSCLHSACSLPSPGDTFSISLGPLPIPAAFCSVVVHHSLFPTLVAYTPAGSLHGGCTPHYRSTFVVLLRSLRSFTTVGPHYVLFTVHSIFPTLLFVVTYICTTIRYGDFTRCPIFDSLLPCLEFLRVLTVPVTAVQVLGHSYILIPFWPTFLLPSLLPTSKFLPTLLGLPALHSYYSLPSTFCWWLLSHSLTSCSFCCCCCLRYYYILQSTRWFFTCSPLPDAFGDSFTLCPTTVVVDPWCYSYTHHCIQSRCGIPHYILPFMPYYGRLMPRPVHCRCMLLLRSRDVDDVTWRLLLMLLHSCSVTFLPVLTAFTLMPGPCWPCSFILFPFSDPFSVPCWPPWPIPILDSFIPVIRLHSWFLLGYGDHSLILFIPPVVPTFTFFIPYLVVPTYSSTLFPTVPIPCSLLTYCCCLFTTHNFWCSYLLHTTTIISLVLVLFSHLSLVPTFYHLLPGPCCLLFLYTAFCLLFLPVLFSFTCIPY
jgi:hypothetical protein